MNVHERRGRMFPFRPNTRELSHDLAEDVTADLLRLGAALLTLVAAIFLGLARVG
jgi:hypothetical protein